MIIAFVFFVTNFFKWFNSRFRSSSIPVIIGFAPQSTIASIVAIKLKPCVITSSPYFTPADLRAILIAAVPELTH